MRRDETTPIGVIEHHARDYDPATEQFLSRDPWVATTREPYGYVAGNPLNLTDPSGEDSWSQDPHSPVPHYQTVTVGLENGLDHWWWSGWHSTDFEAEITAGVWFNGLCAGIVGDPAVSSDAPRTARLGFLWGKINATRTEWDKARNAFHIVDEAWFLCPALSCNDVEIQLNIWVHPNGQIGTSASFADNRHYITPIGL